MKSPSYLLLAALFLFLAGLMGYGTRHMAGQTMLERDLAAWQSASATLNRLELVKYFRSFSYQYGVTVSYRYSVGQQTYEGNSYALVSPGYRDPEGLKRAVAEDLFNGAPLRWKAEFPGATEALILDLADKTVDVFYSPKDPSYSALIINRSTPSWQGWMSVGVVGLLGLAFLFGGIVSVSLAFERNGSPARRTRANAPAPALLDVYANKLSCAIAAAEALQAEMGGIEALASLIDTLQQELEAAQGYRTTYMPGSYGFHRYLDDVSQRYPSARRYASEIDALETFVRKNLVRSLENPRPVR